MKKRISGIIFIAVVVGMAAFSFGDTKEILDNHLQSTVQSAETLSSLGKTKEAVKNYKHAIRLDKYIVLWNENDAIPDYYSGIAVAYSNEEKLEEAEEYYAKTLKAYEKYRADDAAGIARTHLRWALICSMQDKNQETLKHAYEASAYYKDHLEKESGIAAAMAFVWLANAYYNDAQFKEAGTYFDLGIPLYDESVEWGFGDEEKAKMLAIFYKGAAMTYAKAGERKRSEQYEKKYSEWTEFREIKESDLQELIDYYHWLKQ